jgi:lipopolysaccharide transport system permease protein
MAIFSSVAPTGSTWRLSPWSMALGLWRHREIIIQFTRREIEGRYRGSYLGLLWTLITPIVMLLTYTFVFGIVYRARWGEHIGSGLAEFALTIFCGLIAFNLFGECTGRASGLIVSAPNYVKKVVFPLETLPVALLGGALFQVIVSVGILMVGVFFTHGRIPWTCCYLPLVVMPLVFLSLGTSWFLAGLGVFIRDVGNLVTLGIQILFFMTPIFYTASLVPKEFRFVLWFNPLSYLVEDFRRVLLWEMSPRWGAWSVWTLINCMILTIGYSWFMKSRRGFADVM